MKRLVVIALLLAACHSNPAKYSDFADKCVSPRVNTIDPDTGQPYPDKQGSLSDEKTFLRLWSQDLYLWYNELPSDDGSSYSTPEDYFAVLKTMARTATGHAKDRFHFTYPTDQWNQLAQSGVEAGYGMQLVLIAAAPPREVVVAYNEPGSPAAQAGIDRGAHILHVDGAAVVDGSPTILNAGLFPSKVGEQHTIGFTPLGSTTETTVTLTSAAVTNTPVQHVTTLTLANGDKVGYLLFNDNLAQAEKGLIDAITQLKSAGVTDLVVDMRYNGGGYVDIASELGFMVAGPTRTAGKVFERPTFNDKHPTVDPVLNQPIVPTPFPSKALGFSAAANAPLPTLGFPRLYVLTSAQTCSASESVINGLRGVGVDVYAFGLGTCGKPYAFYPQDNCGTTYFSIEIKGVNDKGFGDYPDGFVPAAAGDTGLPGCIIDDDFTHAFGDPAEHQLAAALQYRANGTCPARAARSADQRPVQVAQMPKSVWRQNKWYR